MESELKDKIDVLERKILEERLIMLEEKLDKITNSRAKTIVNVERNMKHLDDFYEKFIIEKKDNKINTVEIFKKVNEFVEPLNIKFSKFEVAKFMKSKGVVRKKMGSHNYYIDVNLNE